MMNYLNFFLTTLTNKKSLVFHLLIIFIGCLDIFFSDIYNISTSKHILFILSLFSISLIFLHLFGIYKKYLGTVVYVFYIILFAELFFSLFLGDVHGKYHPLYNTEYINVYNSRKNQEKYLLSKSEFSYFRKANTLGYPDVEWKIEKAPDVVRIICLGDSFTEGDGAHFDSTYVNFLKRSLLKRYSDIEIFNAGTCGSDPFFNFKSLQDKLSIFQPDIIIQSFTTNDFYQDIITRGGQERFQKDGTLKYRHDYWWERVYAASYIFRILFKFLGGYDDFLIKRSEYPKIQAEIADKTISLFKDYQSFTNENNIDLILLTIPLKPDFYQEGANTAFHQNFQKAFSLLHLPFYSLQPCYEDEIKHTNTSYKDYYWVTDGHHNAKGYKMMAKCIEEIVVPLIEKKIASKNTLVN